MVGDVKIGLVLVLCAGRRHRLTHHFTAFLRLTVADINRPLLNSAEESGEGDVIAENQDQEKERDVYEDRENHAHLVDEELADKVPEVAREEGIICIIAN